MPLDEKDQSNLITVLAGAVVTLLGAMSGLIVKLWKQKTSSGNADQRNQSKRESEAAERKKTEHEYIVDQYKTIVDELKGRIDLLTERLDKIQQQHLESEVQLATARTIGHEQGERITEQTQRIKGLEAEKRILEQRLQEAEGR
jgi:chromosome segregation ATPase